MRRGDLVPADECRPAEQVGTDLLDDGVRDQARIYPRRGAGQQRPEVCQRLLVPSAAAVMPQQHLLCSGLVEASRQLGEVCLVADDVAEAYEAIPGELPAQPPKLRGADAPLAVLLCRRPLHTESRAG
eukprot:COSAG01_NODE_16211_length_1259_cov_1.861207_1_plen_128_part_00